jgi:hypothetical protein
VQGKIALNSKTEIRQAFRSLFSTTEGRRRSNKYYENGSFATAETMFCKYSVKLPLDIVLNDLEARLTPADPGGALVAQQASPDPRDRFAGVNARGAPSGAHAQICIMERMCYNL